MAVEIVAEFKLNLDDQRLPTSKTNTTQYHDYWLVHNATISLSINSNISFAFTRYHKRRRG